MANWKYANPAKAKIYTDYSNKIYLEKGKPKKLTITNWEFFKGADAGPIFKCFVEKEDGQPADKSWAVWDYELTEQLKNRLKGKRKDLDKVEITIVKRGSEFEESFDLS